MTDFLEDKRSEIRTRLHELEPLVTEYRRLEEAAKALRGLNGTSAAATPSATAPRRRPGRPRRSKARAASSSTAVAASGAAERSNGADTHRRGGRRKGSGTRAAQALVFVIEQPGITVPELARKMGTPATYLYKVLPALEQDGKVVKQGRGWHPNAVAPTGV